MEIKRSFEIIYRTKQSEEKKIIQGYAVVFNEWAEIVGGWKECILKGAFEKSLKENRVLALYNHDFNNVLARTGINLKLEEDDKGLRFEIVLPNTNQANDLYELIDRGIVNQCSFAGFVKSDTWESDDDGNITRKINEVDLIEITITPIPAYDVTEAEVKRSKNIKNKAEDLGIDFQEIINKCKQNLKETERYERYLNGTNSL